MKSSRLFALVAFCALFSNLALANHQESPKTIATISPISHSLSTAITQGTEIEVSYIPPQRLPVNRIGSWVRKNSSNKFARYQALVTVSAVRSELDIYPSLRQSNIRIVEIDIAQAKMPQGEKVVLVNDVEYFWLNSNNLLVMLGILKRDLSALWPEYASQFNKNYQAVTAKIRHINLQLDELLMSKDIAFVTPDNVKLSPFVASLASDIGSKQQVAELGLNYLDLTSNKRAAKTAWRIDDFSRFSNTGLVSRIQNQVKQLQAAMSSIE